MVEIKRASSGLEPSVDVALTRGGRILISHSTAKILEHIRETNSLTETAKRMGMSYKGVWNQIKRVQRHLRMKLIESESGGSGGGFTKLSLAGEIVLEDFLILKRRATNFLQTFAILPPDLTIIGSHCPVLELMVSSLLSNNRELSVKLLSAGSLVGLDAIAKGLCEVAGLHILNPKTGLYNTAMTLPPSVRGKIVLVRGYKRVQGLMLRKGNPKIILGVKDLLRRDVALLNRNRSSGTRILLDFHLERLAEEVGLDHNQLVRRVRGYGTEVRSHDEVALAVLNGRADVGLGLECVAAKYGLDFVPLAEENYDFAIRKDTYRNYSVRQFVGFLEAAEFRATVEMRLNGIKFLRETGKLIELQPA